MSPSACVCGMRVENCVLVHAVVLGITTCRRHLPETATSGMLVPTGTLISVNVPSTLVIAPVSGEPEGGAPTTGQLTPGVNASTAALGIYTVTLGRGSAP